MTFPNRLTLQGGSPRLLAKLQKHGRADGDDRFFRLGMLGKLWFVESLNWTTNKTLLPPVSFTAVLVQVIRIQKRKKRNARS